VADVNQVTFIHSLDPNHLAVNHQVLVSLQFFPEIAACWSKYHYKVQQFTDSSRELFQ
jgi:hypothetical protein